MKQIKIGTFSLGHENVDLYGVLDDTGGCFYFQPDSASVGRIKVTLCHPHWDQIVAVLLHEVFEYALDRAKCRYEITQNLASDHAAYRFLMDHTQFSEVCACVAEFIATALPELATAWKRRQKKGKV